MCFLIDLCCLANLGGPSRWPWWPDSRKGCEADGTVVDGDGQRLQRLTFSILGFTVFAGHRDRAGCGADLLS